MSPRNPFQKQVLSNFDLYLYFTRAIPLPFLFVNKLKFDSNIEEKVIKTQLEDRFEINPKKRTKIYSKRTQNVQKLVPKIGKKLQCFFYKF